MKAKDTRMPDNANEQWVALEALQNSAEVYDQQDEPTVSDNNRIVAHLERTVTDLATLEKLLSAVDPVDQLGQVPGCGVRVRHPDCTTQAAADCVSGASCSASCFVATPGVR